MNIAVFDLVFLAGSVATIGDFLIPALISRKYLNYSHLRNTVSTLGTNGSPVKKQIAIWLIISGVTFICFGIGQGMQFVDYSWKHCLYVFGIVAFGVGAGIIDGIFPEDPKGTRETVSGKIHGIGAGLGFFFLLLNPVLAMDIAEFNGMERCNAVFFIGGLVTFIMFLISNNRVIGVFSYSGLWQRLNMFCLYSPLLINYVASKMI